MGDSCIEGSNQASLVTLCTLQLVAVLLLGKEVGIEWLIE